MISVEQPAPVGNLELFNSESFERALEAHLHAHPSPCERLNQALAYALLGGGKRVRPQLVFAIGDLFQLNAEQLMPCAVAIECIHCYSLVHDDLPAMDNDDLRRGKPTVHRAFDEATAILVGDGLQALAFGSLSASTSEPGSALEQVRILARAAGNVGMVGGQALDMNAAHSDLGLEGLIKLHQAKTGALFNACIDMVLALANPSPLDTTSLRAFGEHLGLAFQVRDDLLDAEHRSELLAKPGGRDAELSKVTFPSLMGIKSAHAYLKSLFNQAQAALQPLARSQDNLRALLAIAQRLNLPI